MTAPSPACSDEIAYLNATFMTFRLLTKPQEGQYQKATRSSLTLTTSTRSTRHSILQFQQTLGNHTVQRLIQAKRIDPLRSSGYLQPKLVVGAAGDEYEQEADHIANRVMTMPVPAVPQSIQRQTMPEEKDKDKTLQIKPLAASITPLVQCQTMPEEEENPVQEKFSVQRTADTECVDAGADLENRLSSGQGGSSALPDHVRSYMEPRRIQRYTVPSTLECEDVVDWLDNNSPYSPEWAQTQCTYTFQGNLRISPPVTSGAGVSLTVTGHSRLSVSVSCPIDSPQWSPSLRQARAAVVAAWRRMKTSLDAHEQQHRAIGRAWRATLEARFRGVSFTVTGTDKTDAMSQVRDEIASLQQQWIAEAQADQDAIDPFRGAVLNCP
ncbi:MAG: hypothetical protein NTNFB02_23150 [Nitrospira sp.]